MNHTVLRDVVEIYIDTPTFDKITRDAKTNDIAKLSLIGGTMGLLTGWCWVLVYLERFLISLSSGFSLLSGVEIVYFIIKLVLRICQENIGQQPKNEKQQERVLN